MEVINKEMKIAAKRDKLHSKVAAADETIKTLDLRLDALELSHETI